jgi:adenylosuccinate synthase
MLQAGKFNLVVDGQFGSTGKGKIAAFLAKNFTPDFVSTTNGPNAGHVAVCGDRSFTSKILPAAAIHAGLNHTKYVIGAGALFSVDRLNKEIEENNLPRDRVIIHPRAMVVTEDHAATERSVTKHVASTMQGTAAAAVDKIMRRDGVKLARDYPEIADMIMKEHMASFIVEQMDQGARWLHEGSQGYSLGINHGHSYPFCTSRECTAAQMMSDMGVPPQSIGNIIMVIRPYPIRVGNVVEDGKQVGYSGDVYNDQKEITWEDVASSAGAPSEVMAGELTTVTKRLRRVFSFSDEQLKQACVVNGTTHIVLNFANYIDWSCHELGGGAEAYNELSQPIKDFVQRIESVSGVPVALIGTGAREEHMIVRDEALVAV